MKTETILMVILSLVYCVTTFRDQEALQVVEDSRPSRSPLWTSQEMLGYLRTLRTTPPSLQLHKESFQVDLLNETKKAVGKMEVTITVLAAKKFEAGMPNFLQLMIELGDVKKFSVGYTPAPRPGYKPTDVIPAKDLRCSIASGLISVAYEDSSGWLLGPVTLRVLDESRQPAKWVELKPASKEQEGISQIFGSAIRILVGAIPVVGTAVSLGEEAKKNLDLWFGESGGDRPHLDENKYDIVSTPVFPYRSRIDLTPYPSVTKITVDLPIGFEQSTDLPLQGLIQVKLIAHRTWGFITPGHQDPAPTKIDIVKSLVVPIEVVPTGAVSMTGRSTGRKEQHTLRIAEKPLGEFFPHRAYYVSSDCRKVACIEEEQGKERVVVNGVKSQLHKSIGWLIFSPNSKRLAYMVRDRGNDYIVLDGTKSKPYDLCGDLVFSPNSQRLAFVATTNPGTEFLESCVVLDGVEGKRYRDIPLAPLFSPNSKRLAYKVKEDDKQLVVVDGTEGPRYDGVGQLTFSSDSQRFAYSAHDETGFRVIVEGRQSSIYDLIMRLFFSPDSSTLVYTASSEGRCFLIVDHFDKRERFRISDYSSPIAFSPNGKHLAWCESKMSQKMLVVDGKQGQPYDDVEYPVFSPNSERIAYSARHRRREFIVVDGIEGKKYRYVSQPVFSRDSAHVGHIGVSGEEERLVVDGVEGELYDDIGPIVPVGDELPLTFSPDSSQFAYWARKNWKWHLIVGSREIWSCDGFVLGDAPPLCWDKEGYLHTLGVRSQQILLVECMSSAKMGQKGL